ncbi:MAG: hypothetical protein SCALA702_22480 [Melioribacteraceae bacterium]|nr:MAG: hypothetical protein SCALA702_22480 [Melioribacteraceae bacterium]
MVIDLVVTKTDDGYTGEVPSLKDCESWAHNEDDVIDKCVELVRFYANLSDETEMKIDRARRSGKKIIYKLIFEK